MNQQSWFKGAVAVVTGATAGLGYATARAFGNAGAKVAIVGRSSERVDHAVDALRKHGITCSGYVADVRSRSAMVDAMGSIHDELGPAKVLVANAAVDPNTEFLKITDEEWDLVLETNLKGVFITCQTAAPMMIEAGGGTIITVSSNAATNALPGWAHYSASKAALVALTQCAALELGPHNIRVNCVMLGYFELPERHTHLDEAYRKAMMALNLRGRPGRPDDVSSSILLLASPLADWITGAVLRVDGGSSVGRLGLRPSG